MELRTRFSKTEEVESALECAETDELITLKVLLAEAMLDHPTMEPIHAADQIKLKPEVGQELGKPVEVDPVVPRVSADLASVDDLGGGDQPLDLVADVAQLVVLFVAADIDGLAVDGLLRRLGKCSERSITRPSGAESTTVSSSLARTKARSTMSRWFGVRWSRSVRSMGTSSLSRNSSRRTRAL